MRNKIQVTVYNDRTHVGKLSVLIDGEEISSYEVAAQSSNDVHPNVGIYKLLKTADVPGKYADALQFYGPQIIYLIKKGSTDAADVIIIHGGESDDEGRLFPTEERGLRVSNEDLQLLLQDIAANNITELELEEKPLGFFRKFTTSRVSTGQPSYSQPVQKSGSSITNNLLFWMYLYDFVSDSHSDHHGFSGFGGGNFGGGGAGGNFEETNSNPLIVEPFPKPEVASSVADVAVAPEVGNNIHEGVQHSDGYAAISTGY